MPWLNGQKIKISNCEYCGNPYHRGWQCPQRPKKPSKKSPETARDISTTKVNRIHVSKKKTKTSARLKRDLILKTDRVFSLYLRQQAKQFPYCFICGKPLKYEQMVCLHFISRRFLGVRWNEDNVHVGCFKCNCPDKDQPEVLRKYKQLLGEDVVNNLNQLKNQKISTSEIQEIYDKYKTLI